VVPGERTTRESVHRAHGARIAPRGPELQLVSDYNGDRMVDIVVFEFGWVVMAFSGDCCGRSAVALGGVSCLDGYSGAVGVFAGIAAVRAEIAVISNIEKCPVSNFGTTDSVTIVDDAKCAALAGFNPVAGLVCFVGNNTLLPYFSNVHLMTCLVQKFDMKLMGVSFVRQYLCH